MTQTLLKCCNAQGTLQQQHALNCPAVLIPLLAEPKTNANSDLLLAMTSKSSERKSRQETEIKGVYMTFSKTAVVIRGLQIRTELDDRFGDTAAEKQGSICYQSLYRLGCNFDFIRGRKAV